MRLGVLMSLVLTVAVSAAFSPLILKRRGGAGATAAFSPSDIAGLQLWLKADAIVGLNDGDPLTTWEDSSAENNDATQATGSFKPTYKTSQVDGSPAVSFNDADCCNDFMDLPNAFQSLTAGEIFAVVKMDADPPDAVFKGFIWTFGTNGVDHYPEDDGVVYMAWGSTSLHNTGNPTQSLAVWHLLNVESAANDYKVRLNGAQHYSSGANTVGWSTEPRLGASSSMIGKLAEIIMYDSVLSGADRTNIQNYLDSKYPSLGL